MGNSILSYSFFFFFNDTATTEIYTLSLHDALPIRGFLERHDLAGEYRLNLEANHATLAGHSFHHEVASAISLGVLGSIDVNRGDYQNGWDTDQFPNSVDELALALYEILAAGGLATGGFNFDAKLRRQ